MEATPRDPALPERRRSSEIALYHLAAIVNSAEDGIISKNLDGVVTSWNRAAERIFGYSSQEMIGQPILRLIPPELHWEEGILLARIRAGEQVHHYEAQRVNRKGEYITVALTLSPICDQQGTIIGASKIVRDISRQKELERQVERAKDEFLSNVSHELRTPLTGIRAALRLLEHGGDLQGPARHTASLLRIANSNAERLIRLVDELLDFERLTSGVVLAQLRPCQLDEVVQPAIQDVSASAAEQGISLSVCIDEQARPIPLSADPVRLQQVLLNLLSNALKFSPPGGKVTLSAVAEAENVLLRVRDEGHGIPPDLLESVFDRFRQVDGSDSKPQGGVGLGLAICRRIVEQHGGVIWAERNDATVAGAPGMTFALRLPRAHRTFGVAAA